MANNTLIMGDSYSTFEGYIPEGYAIYYSKAGRPETDVTKVTETWWYQVVEEAGLNLVLNNSWSGSTIGYTGWEMKDNSKTSSFIYRLQKLSDEGFFEKNKIDTMIVFGGTNDSWCDAPLGEMQYKNWKHEDLFFVLPAICCYFKKLKETLPETDIYCCINTGLKTEVSDALKEMCELHSITPIVFENIAKACGHPTIQGMKDIKNKVLEELRQKR